MIKAIDAQQVIIQIDHAARVQQQHPEVQQRYLQVQTQEEKKLLREKIKDAEDTNRTRMREDEKNEKRRNQGGHTDKRENPPDDLDEELISQKMSQHAEHINIKV